jgi:hypothetical protein
MIKFPPVSSESIRLLSHLYPECFQGNETCTAIEAMQLLKSHTIKTNLKSVTNLQLGHIDLSGFKFSYSYTRQNLYFAEQPTLPDIYPGLRSKIPPHYSSFHSSGQGAITSLFLGLSQILKNFTLSHPSRAYFETPLALKLLNRGEDPKGDPILLIDTTSLEPEHVTHISDMIKSFKVMVIDTSLWAWNDPLLQFMIDQVEGKIDLFLVRSHLKLDCFGGEYSTLGSLVYLPSTRTTEEEKEKLVEQIQLASSSISACASLDQIYPFYKEPSFHAYTVKRIQEIKDSMNRMLPQLTPHIDTSRVKFEIPYHRMFFFMNLHSDNAELKKHILKFIRLDSGPVALVDSYGFDFPTVLVTHVRQDKTEYFIRMNGHTLGADRDAEIVETMKKIIYVANTSAKPIR